MKFAAAFPLIALLALGCGSETARDAKPLSEPGEKLYDVRGKVLSADVNDNTLRMDHEAIPGFMEAMVMDYSVRGVRVDTLPPAGSRIEAKLHVGGSGYWLTDIRKLP